MTINLKIYTLGSIIILLGCSSTVIKQGTSPQGKEYTLILDSLNNPCGNRGYASGCYTVINGQHYVYFSSVAPSFVRDHEISHVDGMRHSDWEYDPQQKANCSFITKELLPNYPLGWRICVTHQREWIYKVF